VEVLAGGGPPDVVELTLALAQEMLDAAGVSADPEAALRDGRAMDAWRALIAAQGGDPDAALPRAPEVEEVRADRPGTSRPSMPTASASPLGGWGAGRARKEDRCRRPPGCCCGRSRATR
jgi:thymidine phosphorylase